MYKTVLVANTSQGMTINSRKRPGSFKNLTTTARLGVRPRFVRVSGKNAGALSSPIQSRECSCLRK